MAKLVVIVKPVSQIRLSFCQKQIWLHFSNKIKVLIDIPVTIMLLPISNYKTDKALPWIYCLDEIRWLSPFFPKLSLFLSGFSPSLRKFAFSSCLFEARQASQDRWVVCQLRWVPVSGDVKGKSADHRLVFR